MPASKHIMTLAEFASMGGKARARGQTPEQRRAQAQKAARARWKGHKKKRKKSSTEMYPTSPDTE